MKKRVLISIIWLVVSLVSFQSCLKADLPTLTTTEVSNIKTQTALLAGNVTDDGGAKVELRGICWGTANNPTVADSKEYYWHGTGSFTLLVTGLTPDTYYHVRAFAMNREGTAYGNEVHFTTLPAVEPKVTTTSVGAIRYATARADGYIECNDESILFERGFCVATNENPTREDIMVVKSRVSAGSYYCYLGGLEPGTLYHVRAYAVTLLGITYGADICFKTLDAPPVTTTVTEFTRTSAIIKGNIIWTDDSDGRISNWGICYGTEPNPTVNGYWYDIWDYIAKYGLFPFIKDGVFTIPFQDLTPGTLYYVTAFFTINDGFPTYEEFTQFGNKVSFTTKQ